MTQAAHLSGDGHGDHEHPPYLAHHFDTPAQQFESGKLGMWLFLATEVLMFGGLFCAYAIYRGNHPEVFLYAHKFLDTQWGAINTIILLISSFTMAWGVRAAQLGQQRLLVWMLVLTFLGGTGFMCIKFVEYKSKWEHGLMPGWVNSFYFVGGEPKNPDKLQHVIEYGAGYGGVAAGAHAGGHDQGHDEGVQVAEGHEAAEGAATSAAESDEADASDAAPALAERSLIERAAVGPVGTAPRFLASESTSHGGHKVTSFEDVPPPDQKRVHIFFQIYFLMTGLHGLHVLIGMVVIAWLIWKAAAGVFGPAYFTPVDIGGLYWHLVDLIWIFLFPLLYLIH